MPRASNIYVFTDTESHTPFLAAFTVKYEAFNWARKHSFWPGEGRYLWRLRDGEDWGSAVDITSELYAR